MIIKEINTAEGILYLAQNIEPIKVEQREWGDRVKVPPMPPEPVQGDPWYFRSHIICPACQGRIVKRHTMYFGGDKDLNGAFCICGWRGVVHDLWPDYTPHDLIRVVVMDSDTGKTEETSDWSSWQCTEGNFSCDCNRPRLFDDYEDDDSCVCPGAHRYIIVEADMRPGYTIEEFNQSYPQATFDKAMSMWAESKKGK